MTLLCSSLVQSERRANIPLNSYSHTEDGDQPYSRSDNQNMVYSAAKFQQSNTYQYPTDKKVRKLFEVPTYNIQKGIL